MAIQSVRTLLRHFPLALALLGAVGGAAGCGDESDLTPPSLRILVTNDDGVAAPGIDALVRALAADPRNDVVVVAPSGNRSGSGDATGPSERCGDLVATAATTAGGFAATAVNGCPADCVNHALAHVYVAGELPQLVISGINEGQNISKAIATRLSGTVGAARTAARLGIPALAASQGAPVNGNEYDYPIGVAAVLDWLAQRRATLESSALPPTDVDNLNVPSCAPGSVVRGVARDIPMALSSVGVFDTQDCTSTLVDPSDDVEAFRNGYITISSVPLRNE